MNARSSGRLAGTAVLFPIRYADDFVILASGTCEEVTAEKNALAELLRERLGLEMSSEKTKITALPDGFTFLRHRAQIRWDYRFGFTPRSEIAKTKKLSTTALSQQCHDR